MIIQTRKMVNQLLINHLGDGLNDQLQALNLQMLEAIYEHDSNLGRNASFVRGENQLKKLDADGRFKLIGHLGVMYDQSMTVDEPDEVKRHRFNRFFELLWLWVAPKPKYSDQFDRFCYMMAYLGERLRFLEGRNSEIAKAYLDAFPQDDIRLMQLGSATRSETQ